MGFDAHVLEVLIASPSDTGDERDAANRNLHAWNASRSKREQVILLPRRWETDAVPRLGGTGQSIINSQLVDEADIVIAIFDSRLGQATADALSGTAEEIQRAHASGKPVHVYFSDEPLDRNVDIPQLQALNDFKATLQQIGLLGSYASPDDLGYQVRAAIEHDLEILQLGPVAVRRSRAGATLTAQYKSDREQYTDNKGKLKSKTVRSRIEVLNSGDALAEMVRVELEPVGDGVAPQLHDADTTPNIAPNTSFSYPTLVHMGVARVCEVKFTWTEDGEEKTSSHSISI